MDALLGVILAVGSALSASSASPAIVPRLEVLDEALQRVGPMVEDQVVGQLALVGEISAYGRDVRRVDDRRVQPGLLTQWCRKTELSTARASGAGRS